MVRSILLPPLVAIAAAAVAPAQGRTWIVDQNGGPGTHFTDLPPAVAAAADGDTLVIRSGTYSPFATGKALTLLGQGGVVVRDQLQFPPAVVAVSGLPQDRSFVLKNLRIEVLATSTILSLVNNAGRVHLEDVEAIAPSIPPTSIVACSVHRCSEVTFVNGRLTGFPALFSSESLLTIAGTEIAGMDNCGSIRCVHVGLGMWLQDSIALLSRASVRGGSGNPFNPLALPRPAIRMVRSGVLATGDATTSITAGALGGAGPVPAIDTDAGVLHLDTKIVVRGSQGGPDVAGTALVVRRRIVSLTGAGGPPGGKVKVEIVSPTGDLYQLAASVPADPLVHPSGFVFLDLRHLVLVATGVQGPGERFATEIQVPPDPTLRGAAVAFQAASFSQHSQTLEFSNAAVVVLD